MENPPVKSAQVMAFPAHDFSVLGLDKGVLHSVTEAFDGGRCLEEFALDGFSVGGVPLDDASDLGISCAIQKGVDEGLCLITLGQSRRLLVHGVDVSVKDGMGVLPAVILRHVVCEASELQSARIDADLCPSSSMKEGTTLLAIRTTYGGDLGDVGAGVGGSATDRAIRDDVSVDASIGLYFL